MIEKSITFSDENGQKLEITVDSMHCIHVCVCYEDEDWKCIIMQDDDCLEFLKQAIITVGE